MKSDEFDRAFDDGEDVTSQLDMSAARRPGEKLTKDVAYCGELMHQVSR